MMCMQVGVRRRYCDTLQDIAAPRGMPTMAATLNMLF